MNFDEKDSYMNFNSWFSVTMLRPTTGTRLTDFFKADSTDEASHIAQIKYPDFDVWAVWPTSEEAVNDANRVQNLVFNK